VTASNYHDGWTYQGGAFEQWFNESWGTGLAMNTMRRRVEESNALAGMKTLPLADFAVLETPSAAGIAPYFKDWLAHPDYDGYWKQWSIEDHYANIQVPVLSFAAWYDIFLGGSLKNYQKLKTEAGTDAVAAADAPLALDGNVHVLERRDVAPYRPAVDLEDLCDLAPGREGPGLEQFQELEEAGRRRLHVIE